MATPKNSLDGHRIPAEIKLNILEHLSSHDDLVSLIHAYPEWVLPLWENYPVQLFRRAMRNVLKGINTTLRGEVLIVYLIRKAREDYANSMGSSIETQQDRDNLQNNLRRLLGRFKEDLIEEYILDDYLPEDRLPELNQSLGTILDIGKVIQDVDSLTHRYSNDAWKRIRDIAEETGTGSKCASDVGNLPEIKLQYGERWNFRQAFLRVEIYLLTKYWTNEQGERHILDMGRDIERFIPPSDDRGFQRPTFDSCLRYMFHAYRGYLKKTARELGAPEVPTRDDHPWVRTQDEDYEYEYEDYPTTTSEDTAVNFAQRSVSEEQAFLLWLCEWGIGNLEQTHEAEDSARHAELLAQFSRKQTWETVELRHKFSRYDPWVNGNLSNRSDSYRHDHDGDRNRHPVMSLYGQGVRQGYSELSSPWACASAFLNWQLAGPGSWHPRSRDDIMLNEHGRWITMSDTDRGASDWNPFWLKERSHNDIPKGHPYLLDRKKYGFASLPRRMWLILP